ncbi:MAG: hypothetical protein WB438_06485 [Candidatus Cybelea sp.]|jgi:hypothetical protein
MQEVRGAPKSSLSFSIYRVRSKNWVKAAIVAVGCSSMIQWPAFLITLA